MPASRNHSNDLTDSADEPKTKRRVAAVRATQDQFIQLRAAFEENSRPTKEAKDALAEKTGLFV